MRWTALLIALPLLLAAKPKDPKNKPKDLVLLEGQSLSIALPFALADAPSIENLQVVKADGSPQQKKMLLQAVGPGRTTCTIVDATLASHTVTYDVVVVPNAIKPDPRKTMSDPAMAAATATPDPVAPIVLKAGAATTVRIPFEIGQATNSEPAVLSTRPDLKARTITLVGGHPGWSVVNVHDAADARHTMELTVQVVGR